VLRIRKERKTKRKREKREKRKQLFVSRLTNREELGVVALDGSERRGQIVLNHFPIF
jgi:hypothetical protein